MEITTSFIGHGRSLCIALFHELCQLFRSHLYFTPPVLLDMVGPWRLQPVLSDMVGPCQLQPVLLDMVGPCVFALFHELCQLLRSHLYFTPPVLLDMAGPSITFVRCLGKGGKIIIFFNFFLVSALLWDYSL